MAYIKEEKPAGCVLCHALNANPSDDREHLVLKRGSHALIVMNLYPYNNGHLMVVPHSHAGTLETLSDEALSEMMQLIKEAIAALGVAFGPEGFNVGLNLGKVAGAGIEAHIHFHVVPRWGGDTNFMTVTSGTRVIPEDIRTTYDQIKPHLRHLQTAPNPSLTKEGNKGGE